MPYENGENWRPIDPHKRGRFDSFDKALTAAFSGLITEHDEFFDALPDVWPKMFPDWPVRPGRYEGGIIFLYVPNAPTRFLMQSKLPEIRRRMKSLPGAPKRLVVRLEIHAK